MAKGREFMRPRGSMFRFGPRPGSERRQVFNASGVDIQPGMVVDLDAANTKDGKVFVKPSAAASLIVFGVADTVIPGNDNGHGYACVYGETLVATSGAISVGGSLAGSAGGVASIPTAGLGVRYLGTALAANASSSVIGTPETYTRVFVGIPR